MDRESKLESFQELLSQQSVDISIVDLSINTVLAIILAGILAFLFQKYGHSFSNRKSFSKIFIPLTLVTMVVIAIVKSSLALSLGLVGALSIVRFRAAIKDPEELVFLFLSIAIGLGLGANQRLIVLFGSFSIFLVIIAQGLKKISEESNLYISLKSIEGNNEQIIHDTSELLKQYCEEVNIHNYSSSNENSTLSYSVKFSNSTDLEKCVVSLKKLDKSMSIDVIEKSLI